jgi:hypothetical protein
VQEQAVALGHVEGAHQADAVLSQGHQTGINRTPVASLGASSAPRQRDSLRPCCCAKRHRPAPSQLASPDPWSAPPEPVVEGRSDGFTPHLRPSSAGGNQAPLPSRGC